MTSRTHTHDHGQTHASAHANPIPYVDSEPRGGRQAEFESSNRWRAAPCPGENNIHVMMKVKIIDTR